MRSLGLALLLAGIVIGQGLAQANQPTSPAGRAASPSSTASDKVGSARPDLTPDANGNLSQEQMRQLFRVVTENDMRNDRLLRDYTYTERDVENKLNSQGEVKSTETRTYDVMELYGEQVQRLITKDDKPLSAKDAAKEDAKIQKLIDKRKNESPEDRKKREAKEEKERENDRRFVTEIADAYNFKLVGTESLDGREAWVIDGEPRPGFDPQMKYANILPKFHGRVWIDKDDLQLAKMDVECLDTVSWGLFLARFHKGSRFMLEQTRVNNEVWLPRHVTAEIGVRLVLLKNDNVDLDQTYSDYKKFRTSAKIISVGKVQSPK
ncbi:MAG TPA: hypothetical protein VMU61_00450 [Candidatus Aquilonibacter sp.]|nr:hypothetical protein [Candidatus Aquilonibacter sp.]